MELDAEPIVERKPICVINGVPCLTELPVHFYNRNLVSPKSSFVPPNFNGIVKSIFLMLGEKGYRDNIINNSFISLDFKTQFEYLKGYGEYVKRRVPMYQPLFEEAMQNFGVFQGGELEMDTPFIATSAFDPNGQYLGFPSPSLDERLLQKGERRVKIEMWIKSKKDIQFSPILPIINVCSTLYFYGHDKSLFTFGEESPEHLYTFPAPPKDPDKPFLAMK